MFLSIQGMSHSVRGSEMVLKENMIGVQYLYIETYRDHFEVSSTGVASCTTMASGDKVDAVHIYSSLQKEISGQWISIGSWSRKVTGTEAKMTNAVMVGPGTYRYKSTVYLYRNSLLLEQDDKVSNPIIY